MSPKEIFVENFNQYLMKEHGYKYRPIRSDCVRTTVSASRKKFDIYVRLPYDKYKTWNNETLIIARMYFTKMRAGHGTSLLKFLLEQSKLYEYKYIGLEMTNDDSRAFAKRFNFKPFNGKDWIVSIEDLRISFLRNNQ